MALATVDLFDEAHRSVFVLMQNDSMPGFLKSSRYIKLLKEREAGTSVSCLLLTEMSALIRVHCKQRRSNGCGRRMND